MGTTLASLQDDDGLQVCFVIAIEGYSYLITDYKTPADLFTASTGWHGSGWTTALGGLSLEGVVFEQSITPWDNKIKGNEISFSVMDATGTDQFGIDVFKAGGGNETALAVTMTNAQTTSIKVKDVTNFASSGAAYIGTERINYTSKDAGTNELKTLTRGVYSPFQTDSGANFGRQHTINTKMGTVPAPTKVTDVPRVWIGKWVGIWMHRVVGGVLDTKANAELVHAGKINGIQDSSNGNTVVSVGSVLDVVKDATIMHDQYIGRAKKGIYIDTDFWLEYSSDLTVYGGTAQSKKTELFTATTSDLVEGNWYSVDDFVNIFNEWLGDLIAAGDMNAGVNALISSEWGGHKFVINIETYPGAYTRHEHRLRGPRRYITMLGFNPAGNAESSATVYANALAPAGYPEQAPDNMRSPLDPITTNAFQGASGGTIDLEFADGTWVDTTDDFPEFLTYDLINFTGTGWGVLKVGDHTVVARQVTSTTFDSVQFIPQLTKTMGGSGAYANFLDTRGYGEVRYGDGEELNVSQVVMIEGKLKDLMLKLLATTGVDAHNQATYDMGTAWGSHMGAAIPYKLMDTPFEDSLTGTDLPSHKSFVVLDEPTKFGELFLADLTLRAAYFIFRRGTIRLTIPQTAVSSIKTHDLTEGNKAAPTGEADANRTPTQVTNEYMRNVFKLHYKRDMKEKSKYLEKKTFQFQSSIDDYGESKAITVRARNSYAGPSFGDATEHLAINIVANLLPNWGKPMRRLRRSVDMAFYFDIAPGDIALITDSFARNPEDGTRGITSKPALVLKHSFAVTGGMMGEVDLLIGAIDDTVVYAPTAKIDEDIANSGYTSATPSITVKAHEFSLSSEGVDASHFEAGDLITIEEISPSNPASTTSWDREVASVAGNVITLTATLTSPAWDTAKEYNVFSQIYSAAQATQKADCYLADADDHRILNTRNPYTFGRFFEGDTLTDPHPTTLPEKHSNSWFGDGAPLAVVAHSNLGKMVNNLVGYKTATRGTEFVPTGTAITGPTTAAYRVAQVFPVYLGAGPQSSDGGRLISVSPFMKATGASGVSMRITISRTPPMVDPSVATPALTDTEFAVPYSQKTFTTSSTSYAAITAQTLPAIYNTETGIAYITIELKGSGSHATSYWGLNRFEVGPPGGS
jgi:hypothetical protein